MALKDVTGTIYYDCPDVRCSLPGYLANVRLVTHSIPLAHTRDSDILIKIIEAIAKESLGHLNHPDVRPLVEIESVHFNKFMNAGGDWGIVTGKFGYESNAKHFYGMVISGYIEREQRDEKGAMKTMLFPKTVTIPIANTVIEEAIGVTFKV